MKLSILSTATIILASGLVELATASCFQYWEGTAPFCDSKCPAKVADRTCKGTGKFSSLGNGGSCWTGKKQLCECCGAGPPGDRACLDPQSKKSKCVGLVLMCSRIGRRADGSEIVCSTYACGSCFFG